MRKRPISTAAALFACSMLSLARPSLADEPAPSPSADPGVASESVRILDAQKSGDLEVSIRGSGEANHVRFVVTNKSARRLNVVMPPGLVAAASSGQAFQSMGLGTPTDQPGRFGQFTRSPQADTDSPGFRSVPATAPEAAGLAISPGQTAQFDVPSVCLNFGIPTPTSRNTFTLMDVDDYTQDPRARKALRSLATLGTSQGVAQAVAWNVFNGMTYGQMAKLATQYLNPAEITVAARFVDALDASGTHELVDPAYFREGRILVRVKGEGTLAKVATRLGGELEGSQILGLPAQVVGDVDASYSRPSSMLIDVQLASDAAGRVRARALVRVNSVLGGWTRLGVADLAQDVDPMAITGETLADLIDRGVSSTFVTATPARRGTGSTTLRIVNRLPFTLEGVVVRTSRDEDAPRITFDDLGVGPNRAAMAKIQAPVGIVERVVLNGL